ncbi:unnamed protein product [Bursaphelenchus okinawaensis]|uniref:Uncharacterized protein n=1 Tax=Bursaphelenchus okinawaensis TaxID=465554 RepID=A0A811LHA4_9BILA|nr:unnamed protein product [Bursaphelenchus okinawaensis]CAG9122349.1 unnamed protein product [Bursaphelenchus okinawaensis]
MGFWRQMPWLYVTHVLFQLTVISFMMFISLLLVIGGSAVTWLGAQIYINMNGHYYGLLGFFIFLCCALNAYFVVVTCIGWRQLKLILRQQKRMIS